MDPGFRSRFLAIPPHERDAWVDRELGLPDLPPDGPLPRGAVPYLPCAADDILAFVDDAPVGPDDTVVDIGAGLGRVVFLAHLLGGARAHGIEVQPHLVALARDRAAALSLPVTFAHADAADTPLDGSRFFLYAPCNGELLARVVARLADVARRRPIVVGTVDLGLDEPWLVPRRSSRPSLSLYGSTRA